MSRTAHDWMCPVSHVASEVLARYAALNMAVDSKAFEAHVRANLEHLGGTPYVPTFAKEHIRAKAGRKRSARGTIVRALSNTMDALEHALALCITARIQQEKPLAALLDLIRYCCRQADESHAAVRQAEVAYTQARRSGGLARQASREPARAECIRLWRDLAPPAGWSSAKEAAGVITPLLKEFILRERISVVAGDHLIRTVRRWILAEESSGGP